VSAFQVKLGANDLNRVDVLLNSTHSMYVCLVVCLGVFLCLPGCASLCQSVSLSVCRRQKGVRKFSCWSFEPQDSGKGT